MTVVQMKSWKVLDMKTVDIAERLAEYGRFLFFRFFSISTRSSIILIFLVQVFSN